MSQKQLPKGWEWKKLGEVCEINPSKREIKTKFSGNTNISFLPMADLGILSKNTNLNKVRELSEVEGSYTYFAENDVLLAKITPCFENGKLGIARKLINGIGFGSSEYIVFRPHSFLFNEYLFYFLSQESFRHEGIARMSGAVGHKRIAKDFIESYLIPLPPLAEQKRIVATLDKAFAAIDKAKANTEKNLANVKELFESYLNRIFTKKGEGWEEKKLGEVCEVINGGTPKTSITEYWGGDIHWVTPADLGKLKTPLVYDTPRKITELGLKKSSAKLFPKNSVILSTRAPIGHLAINQVAMSTNQGCRGIIPNTKLATWFLYYFLKKNVNLLENLGVGATFKELSTKTLAEVKIPLPPLPEQEQIVHQLNTLRTETQKLETIYQNKIQSLNELKKSILQKAFKGEL